MKKITVTLEVDDNNVNETIEKVEELLDNSTIECFYNIEEKELLSMNKLEKLHTEVKKLEEHYEDCSTKAMEKNNIQAIIIYSAEACAFTRVRWMIESMMEVEL